jgi:hypothetical protein
MVIQNHLALWFLLAVSFATELFMYFAFAATVMAFILPKADRDEYSKMTKRLAELRFLCLLCLTLEDTRLICVVCQRYNQAN